VSERASERERARETPPAHTHTVASTPHHTVASTPHHTVASTPHHTVASTSHRHGEPVRATAVLLSRLCTDDRPRKQGGVGAAGALSSVGARHRYGCHTDCQLSLPPTCSNEGASSSEHVGPTLHPSGWRHLSCSALGARGTGGVEPCAPSSMHRGKEAWPFYRTISGVRLCWELEESKGPKGTVCSEPYAPDAVDKQCGRRHLSCAALGARGTLSLRLKDLLGPVTRSKKNKKNRRVQEATRGRRKGKGGTCASCSSVSRRVWYSSASFPSAPSSERTLASAASRLCTFSSSSACTPFGIPLVDHVWRGLRLIKRERPLERLIILLVDVTV